MDDHQLHYHLDPTRRPNETLRYLGRPRHEYTVDYTPPLINSW